MISDDVCSPLSLGEGWGEAPIKISAPPMSSSARKKRRGPLPTSPRRGRRSDITDMFDVFIIQMFLAGALSSPPSGELEGAPTYN